MCAYMVWRCLTLMYCSSSIYRGLVLFEFCVFNHRYYTNNTGSKALVAYSIIMYISETTFLVVLQIDVVAVEVVGRSFKLVCHLLAPLDMYRNWGMVLGTPTQKLLLGCLCKLCNFIFNLYLISNSPKFYLHANSAKQANLMLVLGWGFSFFTFSNT